MAAENLSVDWTIHTGMSVVTLGVAAGPALRSNERGIATAVVVNSSFYMIDFGLGCTRGAHEAGLRGTQWRAGFVTHLHSDHVAEIPAFLLWNWGSPVSGFTTPVRLFGPGSDPAREDLAGFEALMAHVQAAYSYDISIRQEDEGRPDLGELIRTSEISLSGKPIQDAPVLVYADEHVRVSAILVDHPPVYPAFGFRLDSEYGSVVLSGDTAECSALAAFAAGADLLVHEAVNLDYYRARDFPDEFLRHQEKSHTTPEGAGRIAAQAGVRALVLSHLAGKLGADEWQERAATEFRGRIDVATSGQIFRVGAAVGE